MSSSSNGTSSPSKTKVEGEVMGSRPMGILTYLYNKRVREIEIDLFNKIKLRKDRFRMFGPHSKPI